MRTAVALVCLVVCLIGLGITQCGFGVLAFAYALKERLFSTPNPRQSIEIDSMTRSNSYGRAW